MDKVPPLPREIQIGAHKISIERKPGLINHSEAYGLFDATALSIHIDDSLSEGLAWETFWHEVMEALNFFSEADLEHKSIQVMALLLHQVADSVFVDADAGSVKGKAPPGKRSRKKT